MANEENEYKAFVEQTDTESTGITIDVLKADDVAASDADTGVAKIEQSLSYKDEFISSDNVERKLKLDDTLAKVTNKSIISHELVNQKITIEEAKREDADLTIIGKATDCTLSNDEMVFDGVQGFVSFARNSKEDEDIQTPTIRGLYNEVVRLQGLCNTLVAIINNEIFGSENAVKITERGLNYEFEKLQHFKNKADDSTDDATAGETVESKSLLDYINGMDDYYKFRVATDAEGTTRGSVIWEDDTVEGEDIEATVTE